MCLRSRRLLSSQSTPREQVGPLPTGGFLLNSGWRLDPAGKQVPLSTFPMSSALTPDGKHLLVLNGGYRPPTISVIDTASGAVTGSVPVTDAWLGLAISPRGDRVYVGGGSAAAVFEFSLQNGALTQPARFRFSAQQKPTPQDFIGDVALSPDGRLIYAADLYRDSVAVINPQSGMVINRYKTGRRPYRILFPSRRQIVLRDPLGRRHHGPLRYRHRQPARRRCASARIPPIWSGATAGPRKPRPASRRMRRACSWPPRIPITCTPSA